MDPFSNITHLAMRNIFSRSPFGFQEELISHIIKMMVFEKDPNPVLIVQPTGTGKSTVPFTVSVLDAGITIIIENTIALGIDQTSKTNFISSSSNKLEIQCYHLDNINDASDQKTVSSLIIQTCHLIGNTAFILFIAM